MPWNTRGSTRRSRKQSASVCEAKTSRAACSAFSLTWASTRLSPAAAPSGCRLSRPFPSRQVMTSSSRISSGRRASVCPPRGPRVDVTRPARRSVISTWSRNGPGMLWRRAISPLWRAPRPALAASSTMARTPYSVFIEKRIRIAEVLKVDQTGQVYRRPLEGEIIRLSGDPKRQDEKEGAQHDQGHRGRDQAQTAQADRAPIFRRRMNATAKDEAFDGEQQRRAPQTQGHHHDRPVVVRRPLGTGEGVEAGGQHPDQRDQHPERDQRQVDAAHRPSRLGAARELPGRGEDEGHVGGDHDIEEERSHDLAERDGSPDHAVNLVFSDLQVAASATFRSPRFGAQAPVPDAARASI